MEGSMKDNGLIINNREKDYLFGQMDNSLMENIKMMFNADTVNFNFQMAVCIKEDGRMISRTEKGFSRWP
jgi:hypothetical protein